MGVLQGLVSDGGTLYAAWKGEPNDNRIFYAHWSGSGNWTAGGTIPGNTSAGPSLGIYNGAVYAAWKGEWSDPRLFFSKYSNGWDAQQQIPNAYSDTGPALCQQGSNLIAVWKSVFDDNLMWSAYNGTNWTTPAQISGVGSSVGPSLASYGGTLYAGWKGAGGDQRLWSSTFNGSSWTPQAQIEHNQSSFGSSVGPSLAAVGRTLYAVWKGQDTDEALYFSTNTGSGWAAQTPIAGQGSSIGPAAADFNDALYIMCKGSGSDVSLHNNSYNGTAWSGWGKAIPGNTGPDTQTPVPLPSANPSGSTNYFCTDNTTEKYVSSAGVTILVTGDIIPDSTTANGVTTYDPYAFQFNCWTPTALSKTCAWQQYGITVASGELFFWVNNWPVGVTPSSSPLIQWDSRPKNGSPSAYFFTVPTPNNTLPKGWQLTIRLVNDKSSGNVTGFTGSVTEANGAVHNLGPVDLLQCTSGSTPNIQSTDLAPIDSFMIVLVKNNGGQTTDFVQGQGIFTCNSANALTSTTGVPTTDPQYVQGTGENSNITYTELPVSYPNGEFWQEFGVPPL